MAVTLNPTSITVADNVGAGTKLADISGVKSGNAVFVIPNRQGRYIVQATSDPTAFLLLAGPGDRSVGAHSINISDGVTNVDVAVTVTDSQDAVPPKVLTVRSTEAPEGSLSSIALRADKDVTWSILPGADGSSFGLVGARLSLPGQVYNASKPTYVANLRATDKAANTVDFTVTVAIQKWYGVASAGDIGLPVNALTLNGVSLTLNGQSLTLGAS